MKLQFKKWKWIYLPISLSAYGILIAALLLIARIFMIVDMKSHSGSDTLINVFPWMWIIMATYLWIGSNNTQK
jgi:hypothetical protein